jgi:hypothetical protein
METSTVIATIGVSLLLIAFFLNLTQIQKQNGWVYLSMNLIGAALACYASYLIHFFPFVILEGSWAAVAMIGIFRKAF